MLKQKTRKTRADHAVKCNMMSRKKVVKSKSVTELYVDDKLTEDREELNQELQRNYDEV